MVSRGFLDGAGFRLHSISRLHHVKPPFLIADQTSKLQACCQGSCCCDKSYRPAPKQWPGSCHFPPTLRGECVERQNNCRNRELSQEHGPRRHLVIHLKCFLELLLLVQLVACAVCMPRPKRNSDGLIFHGRNRAPVTWLVDSTGKHFRKTASEKGVDFTGQLG